MICLRILHVIHRARNDHQLVTDIANGIKISLSKAKVGDEQLLAKIRGLKAKQILLTAPADTEGKSNEELFSNLRACPDWTRPKIEEVRERGEELTNGKSN